MASFSIIPRIAHKFVEFSTDEVKYIILACQTLRNLDEFTKGFVVGMFNLLPVSATQPKKDILLDALDKLAYQQVIPRMFRVAEGESYCLQFTLAVGEDFTGKFLTARNSEDNALLSPNNIAGDSQVNAPTQSIPINDLSLTSGIFYKLNYLVETDSGGGTASGNAETLLTDAFLIVTPNVDAI